MSHKREALSLSQLVVNIENPRFEIVSNQREALLTMIEDQNGKLERLAADIVEYGLSPHEAIIVAPHKTLEGHYNVLEGNRRVTALKLLFNPNLVPDKNKALSSKLRKLSLDFLKRPIDTVNCVIFQDEKDAFRWVKLIHTGENDGIGRVTWDAQQKSRYEERAEGKSSLALQVLNFLQKQNDFDQNFKHQLKNIPLSSLQRLVGDPNFRGAIGIDFKNGEAFTNLDPTEVIKPLKKVVKDLISNDFSIKDIYYKEDRLKYIDSFESCYLPDKTNTLAGNWQLNSINVPVKPLQKTEAPVATKNILNSSHTARTALVPRDLVIKINQPFAQQLFDELKSLDLRHYTLTGAVSLIHFIHYSIDLAILKLKVPEVSITDNLAIKVDLVANYFIENGYFCTSIKDKGPKDFTSLNSILPSEMDELRFKTNNFPEATGLRKAWDDVEPLIIKIWELI